MVPHFSRLTLFAACAALVGCAQHPAAPVLGARVVAVVPSGGATGVDPHASIVVAFSHPMQSGMEQYAALHEGDATGPVVPGNWVWSDDRTMLSFMPSQPLKARTTYTLHLGGGMRAMDGGFVDYGPCVAQHGGRWVTQDMMGGGMPSPGWRYHNGTYGMVFTFTTA